METKPCETCIKRGHFDLSLECCVRRIMARWAGNDRMIEGLVRAVEANKFDVPARQIAEELKREVVR